MKRVEKKELWVLLCGMLLLLGMIATAYAYTTATTVTATRVDTYGEPSYGATYHNPSFKVTSDDRARISMPCWVKQNGDKWDYYSGTTFVEGTYRMRVQLRTDTADYRITDDTVLKVDEVTWTSYSSVSDYYEGNGSDKYGYKYYYSPSSFKVTASSAYLITMDRNMSHGEVLTDQSSASAGTKVTLTVNPKDGYGLESIKVVGPNGEVSLSGSAYTRTFTMPSGSVVIYATFSDANPLQYITEVEATCSNYEAPIVGADVNYFSFTVTKGSPAKLANLHWEKYVDGQWKYYGESTFTEGQYRFHVQVRTETKSVRLTNTTTFKVNGTAWTKDTELTDCYESGGYGYNSYTSPVFTAVTPKLYTISIKPCQYVNCSSSVSSAAKGTKVTLTVSPKSGYEVTNIRVSKADGTRNTIELSGSGNTRTFTMPAENVNVSVAYRMIEYTVSFNAGAGTGTMSSVETSFKKCTLPACTFTPPSGQEFDYWLVGSTHYSAGAEITVSENTTVIAKYKAKPTPMPTATNTPIPTATNTPIPTATNTPIPTATNTPIPTATNTPIPTATNTPKPTATNTPKPTATNTPKPTATNTPKPTATNTPKPTATNTPKPTATSTPKPTETPIPVVVPTESPIPTEIVTDDPGVETTDVPTTEPTEASVTEPTESPIPTEIVTDDPGVETTDDPVTEPTDAPSIEPSVAPTTEISEEPTAESTVEASQEVAPSEKKEENKKSSMWVLLLVLLFLIIGASVAAYEYRKKK